MGVDCSLSMRKYYNTDFKPILVTFCCGNLGGPKAYILKSGGGVAPLAPLVPPPMINTIHKHIACIHAKLLTYSTMLNTKRKLWVSLCAVFCLDFISQLGIDLFRANIFYSIFRALIISHAC